MLNQQQRQYLEEIRLLVDRTFQADQEPIPIPPIIQPPPEQPLADVIATAPEGAIIDLQTNEYLVANFDIERDNLTFRGGVFRPSALNVNDMLLVRGNNITFERLDLAGDGTTTKRGIAQYGRNLTIADHSQLMNFRRANVECQPLAVWDSTGPLTVRDTTLEGSTQSFLAGGASPTIPNTIPTQLTFERCLFTRPLAWRGTPGAYKTIFELKSARDVLVRDCILENMWAAGQNAIAITLHSSQYGNSPENVVERVRFENCTIRNVGGGASLLGYSQHQNDPARQTLRGNTYSFIGNTFEINKTLYGGQGALMTIGWEPENIVWEGNTVTANGDAFQRLTDLKPVRGFRFERSNTVTVTGTYGTYAPNGNYRGAGWSTLFPDGVMEGNTFSGAHATFRSNFPNNTYV